MRTAIIILLATILLTACGKDKKSCWGCVLIFSDGYVASYRDSMICDKTQGEINDMKRMTFDARHLGYETYGLHQCSRIK